MIVRVCAARRGEAVDPPPGARQSVASQSEMDAVSTVPADPPVGSTVEMIFRASVPRNATPSKVSMKVWYRFVLFNVLSLTSPRSSSPPSRNRYEPSSNRRTAIWSGNSGIAASATAAA